MERSRNGLPCDHFEKQPPHIRNSKSCFPEPSPRTREPESSAATKDAPHAPHSCSAWDGRCLIDRVTSANEPAFHPRWPHRPGASKRGKAMVSWIHRGCVDRGGVKKRLQATTRCLSRRTLTKKGRGREVLAWQTLTEAVARLSILLRTAGVKTPAVFFCTSPDSADSPVATGHPKAQNTQSFNSPRAPNRGLSMENAPVASRAARRYSGITLLMSISS